MPSNRTQQEGRIQLAKKAYEKGEFNNVKDTARAYDVPFSTLRARINGRVSRALTRPPR